MRRQSGFTLIELLMVLMIIGTLLAMTVPNFKNARNAANVAAVKLNMRQVAVAITTYYAENGHYADDFYEDGYGYIFDGGTKDQTLGRFPTNPFTGRQMEPDEFNVDEYDSELDVTNTEALGPNDEWGYNPGEMCYRTYTPLGNYYPTMWGLVGFDPAGRSIRDYNADGDAVIFVLH